MNLQEEEPWQGFCMGNPGPLGMSSCPGTQISWTGEPGGWGEGAGCLKPKAKA